MLFFFLTDKIFNQNSKSQYAFMITRKLVDTYKQFLCHPNTQSLKKKKTTVNTK